jgi:ABC-type uncharacterized transport system fused permease/ATPase subunit
MYLENVLKELERIAQIAFKRGNSEELEQVMEKLDQIQEDAMLYYKERRKEENE